MKPQIRKATRKKAKLRLALVGPTGSGKTYSSLLLASGIGKKIGVIDTENGSGDLYAHLCDYDIITLEPPYTVQSYREAIRAFEDEKYDVIIIDSLSHAWAGQGGLLDKQGQLENSGKFRNSFATWREITPEHNKLVEEIIGSPCHVIATMRSKMEYVIETNDKGKQVPRKIGLSPVQRDGVEYEFTLVMDVNENHYASATKDRTSLFDGWHDKISIETGKKLVAWLDDGVEPEKTLEQLCQEYVAKIAACKTEQEVDAVMLENVRTMDRALKENEKWHAALCDRVKVKRAELNKQQQQAEG